MMRRHPCIPTLLQLLILVSLPLVVSHAQSDPLRDTSPYVWSAQTATAAGRVRVTITKAKPKLHLPKAQRSVVRLAVNDDNDYYDERPEFQVGYRRPELVNCTAEVHDDLSDEIKLRLVLARKRALERYHEKWG
jgi:hypothetical protein